MHALDEYRFVFKRGIESRTGC